MLCTTKVSNLLKKHFQILKKDTILCKSSLMRYKKCIYLQFHYIYIYRDRGVFSDDIPELNQTTVPDTQIAVYHMEDSSDYI